jgi:hypothetical protein
MTFIYSRENYVPPNPLLQGEPKVPPNPLLQGEPNVFREAPLLLRPKLRDKIIHFYNKEGVWGNVVLPIKLKKLHYFDCIV